VFYLAKENKTKGDVIFKKNELIGEILLFVFQGHLLRASTKNIFAKQGSFVGVDNLFVDKYSDFYDD
jgi:hypothetical protein